MKQFLLTAKMLVLFGFVKAQKVYSVDYENQVDLKIYFGDYENQVGWGNKSKQHLIF
jgi:hypothetical protein